MPGVGVARHVLAQHQDLEVLAAGDQHRRHQPGQDDSRPDREPGRDPHRAQHVAAARRDRPDDDREQRRQQADGTLGERGQAGGDEEPAVEHRPLLGEAAHEAPERERHERDQRHVDLADPPLPEDLGRGDEDQRRPPGDAAVEQARGDAVEQEQRGERGRHRRQTGGDLVHAAGEVRGDGDRPEVERRLLRVDAAVEVRHDPVAVLAHLARHLGVARLVRVPEVAGADSRQEDRERQDEQERPLATAHSFVSSSLASRRSGSTLRGSIQRRRIQRTANRSARARKSRLPMPYLATPCRRGRCRTAAR